MHMGVPHGAACQHQMCTACYLFFAADAIAKASATALGRKGNARAVAYAVRKLIAGYGVLPLICGVMQCACNMCAIRIKRFETMSCTHS
jgi:hypothetical protein